MSVEYRWKDTDKEIPNEYYQHLTKSHLVHHDHHMN